MRRLDPKMTRVAIVLAVITFGSGFALGASLAVTNGGGENGSGVYHTGTNSPAWWSESAVGFNLVPSGLSTLSATVGAPTVLATSSSSYAINAPIVGDWGHYWKLQETSSATINTELELKFQVATGGGAYSTRTVYLETQSTAPASTLTFTTWFDLGSASAGPTANNVVVVWLVCSAIGTCP